MPGLFAPALLRCVMLLVDCLLYAEVAGGRAYADCAFSGCCDPLGVFRGPILQLTLIDVEGDGFGFTRGDANAVEGDEGADGELHA